MKRTLHGHAILRVTAKILIPYILLFALYVQFHGDFSPGGGFQAGVIFATGIILYTLIFGLDRAFQTFHPRVFEILMALGVCVYGGVGVVALLSGGQYLDYGMLSHDPVHGQHLGLLLVELGVGLTVTSAMVSIFFAFLNRGREG